MSFIRRACPILFQKVGRKSLGSILPIVPPPWIRHGVNSARCTFRRYSGGRFGRVWNCSLGGGGFAKCWPSRLRRGRNARRRTRGTSAAAVVRGRQGGRTPPPRGTRTGGPGPGNRRGAVSSVPWRTSAAGPANDVLAAERWWCGARDRPRSPAAAAAGGPTRDDGRSMAPSKSCAGRPVFELVVSTNSRTIPRSRREKNARQKTRTTQSTGRENKKLPIPRSVDRVVRSIYYGTSRSYGRRRTCIPNIIYACYLRIPRHVTRCKFDTKNHFKTKGPKSSPDAIEFRVREQIILCRQSRFLHRRICKQQIQCSFGIALLRHTENVEKRLWSTEINPSTHA